MKVWKFETTFICGECGKETDESYYQHTALECVECTLKKILLRVPEIYKGCSLDDFKELPDFLKIKADPFTSTFIWGPVGTGKTRLGWAIWSLAAAQGKDPCLVTWTSMLEVMKAAMDDSTMMSVDSLIKMYQRAGFLIIDDFGGIREQRVTDWANDRTFDILDYRNQHQMPTVITSNKRLPDVERDFDARIASRIVELCPRIVMMGGKDRRVE
jgi:DNA replication protein DnaC/DNA-directed RNA polymerase subunit RPC12/RpoP